MYEPVLYHTRTREVLNVLLRQNKITNTPPDTPPANVFSSSKRQKLNNITDDYVTINTEAYNGNANMCEFHKGVTNKDYKCIPKVLNLSKSNDNSKGDSTNSASINYAGSSRIDNISRQNNQNACKSQKSVNTSGVQSSQNKRKRRPTQNIQECPSSQNTNSNKIKKSGQSKSQGPPLEYVHLGRCNQVCEHRGAKFWLEEKLARYCTSGHPAYHKCCLGGRVVLEQQQDYPEYIKQLYEDKHFMENIRAYNQMSSMKSFGAKVDDSINKGSRPYVFRISGQICHNIGSLCPEEEERPCFLRLYIYDTDNEVENRMFHFGGEEASGLKREIVEGLIDVLDNNNAVVQLFQTARDKYMDASIPKFKVKLYNVARTRRYELPTAESVGAIVFEESEDAKSDFDVIIEEHSRTAQRVNKLHSCYMSLQFPLLFVYSEEGYHINIPLNDEPGRSSRKEKKVSMKMYYAYHIHECVNRYNLLPRAGRLFQQYLVTAYCSIEQSRMDYIQEHLNDIRNEYLSGLYDAIMRGDRDRNDVGTRIILPASFTGCPRYMYSHYLDALAICRVHGNPLFFITFTCNAKWPEIQEYLQEFPQLTAADRADVIVRVFERKVQDYIKFLQNNRPFGHVTAVLYTIEFQKRGLPHCHTLLWISESTKIRNDQEIDAYISAEIPDETQDPEGHIIVSEFMIHGPCGRANTNAPCMQGSDKCNRNFSKQYCDATHTDKDGYVHYRRRATGVSIQKHNVKIDNAYVVPYNRLLCMRYYAHINVEYYGWTMLIKYLFKYISKGTDRVVANITRPIGESPSTVDRSTIEIDEIRNFLEARYIGPHEACWTILQFDIHSRVPAVQILAVHLEGMQRVAFRAKQSLESIIANPCNKKTTLTEWLDCNSKWTDGRHLTYLNFPSEFVWYNGDKYWQRRKRSTNSSIGRLTYIHPSCGDLYYQRILLCHQTGCQSFRDIRTIDKKVYPTNRAACEAMGLLGDDKEWKNALEEAAFYANASQLRALFVQILIFCDVSNPVSIWKDFWKQMSEDVPNILSKTLGIPTIQKNDAELEACVLCEVEGLLNGYSRSLPEFALPLPPKDLLNALNNRLLMEERNYDREMLKKEKELLIPKLNKDQKIIFDLIVNASANNKQELVFVYSHGGTGKTFLWKTIICTLHSEAKIILAVASSGIASLLLLAGRTAHSRFKLPLDLTDESMCNIKKGTHIASLLKETDLIIWDEAPMNDRRCFETLDHTLRDILDAPTTLFGGKIVMLGGDFRQTLPVKKNATKNEIISSSIAESYLWRSFKVFSLHENMRLRKQNMLEHERLQLSNFSQWLLDVGDGKIGIPDEAEPDCSSWVQIPDEFCIRQTEDARLQLIQFIYDNETLQRPTAKSLQDKAIVCPKNETADLINTQVLQMLEGELKSYNSSDDAIPKENDGGETELLYPTEYLNSIRFSGFPPHKLQVKIGTPIILLRNLNLIGGLCNGTRMIVTQLLNKVIEAQIITGTRITEKVFLPRVVLIHKDEKMLFHFKRKQFPIKFATP